MNSYSIPPLISSILFLISGLFVFLKNKKSMVNLAFMLTCLVTFWWQFSWFILFNTYDENIAQYLVKIGYTGIIFIPITFFHFFIYFLGPKRIDKWIMYFSYILGVIFEIFLWTTNYFIDGFYKYFWGFYPKANFMHLVYLSLLFFLSLRALYLLFSSMKEAKKDSPYRYNQIKYVLLALILYIPASSDFIVNYGVEFYPFGFIFVLMSLSTFEYAIVKHRLMDIKVTISRAGISLAVYSLVFVLPFWVGEKTNSWKLSTPLAIALAIPAPLIYTHLKKKAENIILAKQKKYQKTLIQAAQGMVKIKELKHLINLIVHIVTKSVRVSMAAIFLLNKEKNLYRLEILRDRILFKEEVTLSLNHPLIKHLSKTQKPLLLEDIPFLVKDKDSQKEVKSFFNKYKIHLIVPSFIENQLLGFLALGSKPDNEVFTQDDINVFGILASQAALAIENCLFLEEFKKTQQKIASAEKIASIGEMATQSTLFKLVL